LSGPQAGGTSERLEEPPKTWTQRWAIARYDLGLSDYEFDRLTLPKFEALCERRFQDHRRQCYYAGIVAATDVNINSTSKTPLSPMAFVPGGFDRDKQRRERVKQNIRSIFGMQRPGSPEESTELRLQTIDRLKKTGHDDADKLFNEVFPTLSRVKQ
ncbi:MAG: hypothetical protein ACRD3W_28400, partial [Terriglobales bacterium]